MWRPTRRPRQGDRRAVALDATGLVRAGSWRTLRSQDSVWALEEYDGQLWHLQGVSTDAAGAARFTLSSRLSRR
jgi:hypothetical protein